MASRSRSRSPPKRSRSRSPPKRSPPKRSRSRSRSRGSPYRSGGTRNRGREQSDHEMIEMSLGNDDIAFVLGRGGMTKRKIARVSGANLEILEREMKLTIVGSPEARVRAKEYVSMVLAQRVGPVFIDFDTERADLTVVEVPSDCVGYVTGRRGTVLRTLEEEWGTLMFFAKQKSKGGDSNKDSMEKLAIFGPKRGRRAARLKVLSAVEHKCPGFVLKGNKCRVDLEKGIEEGEDWGCDLVPLAQNDFSYALGKMGSTRKKLAWASGCIVQYIGQVAFFSGTRAERRRGQDYLQWLIAQRTGRVSAETEGRDDVTVVHVPTKCVGFITGYKGASLRLIEKKSGTFCFADGRKERGSRSSSSSDTERLLIFSHAESNRRHGKELVEDMIKQKERDDERGYGGGGGGGYGGGGGRSNVCFDFQKGRCDYGASCRYSHEGEGGGRWGGGGGGGYDRRGDRRGDDRRRRRRSFSRSRSRGRSRSRSRGRRR